MSASEIGTDGRPPKAAELYAAARVIGNKCFDENFDFMKCKSANRGGPTSCQAEGETVHRCVYGLYKDISAKAAKQFKDHALCLDSADLQVAACKKTQAAFESSYYAA